MRVRECLHRTPVTVPAGCTVLQAAETMAERDVGSLLVVEGDRLLGIVTDRDLVVRSLAVRRASRRNVTEIMSSPVTTVQGSDDVSAAIEIFRSGDFRRLPVLEDGKLAGIVTVDDLLVRLLLELAAVASPVAREVFGLRGAVATSAEEDATVAS